MVFGRRGASGLRGTPKQGFLVPGRGVVCKGTANQPKKCEVWGPAADKVSNAFRDITLTKWTPSSGIVNLGVPISYPQHVSYLTEHWNGINKTLQEAIDTVTLVSDCQTAHTLLRFCIDGCRVNHLLRSADCYTDDSRVKEAVMIIL